MEGSSIGDGLPEIDREQGNRNVIMPKLGKFSLGNLGRHKKTRPYYKNVRSSGISSQVSPNNLKSQEDNISFSHNRSHSPPQWSRRDSEFSKSSQADAFLSKAFMLEKNILEGK